MCGSKVHVLNTTLPLSLLYSSQSMKATYEYLKVENFSKRVFSTSDWYSCLKLNDPIGESFEINVVTDSANMGISSRSILMLLYRLLIRV